jgi:LemA protein
MLYIILGVAAAILLGFVLMYNSLIAMRRMTDNAWADMDVYLQRRAQLVPNLVETVKGAAAYERTTLERITEARASAVSSHEPTPEKIRAEGALTAGVGRILAVAESYPELRANQSFLGLQKELSESERLIASARQYYNACVRDYNTLIESFPHALIAGSMGLKPRGFFEVEELMERSAPAVKGL